MQVSEIIFDKNKKIWTAPRADLIWNTECALGRIIYNQLNSFPNTTIQIDHSANVTLKSHDALTMGVRIAQHFHDMQLKQDDIIGFAVRNTTYVLPTVIGCFFNCTPFHPVNPILEQSILEHCFNITKPKIIFCDSDVYRKVYLATKAYKPKIITISGEVKGVAKITDFLKSTMTEKFYQPKNYSIGGHQTVAVLCSSGTSGKPKAVCLSGFNLIMETHYLNSESVMYSPSAIDWTTGLTFMLVSCLTGATRIIADKPFNADDFIEIVKKYKITCAFLAPRYIAALVEHPRVTKEVFSSLLVVQVAGSMLQEKTCKSFKALLNDYCLVLFYYGLTEVGVLACNMDVSRMNSVGKLIPGISLRIVDDHGKHLGHNEVGEILLNHGKHWDGYYGNSIETKQMRDEDGWFHTGDLGYMAEDNYLYVVDRKKEIRKYLGIHFWPNEIEGAIVEIPGVKDACVITVTDETKGDSSGALVVKEPNSCLTEQDVIEYVKKRLVAVHKQIHAGVFFVDKIPQNCNGKIMRPEGKKIFEAMLEGS